MSCNRRMLRRGCCSVRLSNRGEYLTSPSSREPSLPTQPGLSLDKWTYGKLPQGLPPSDVGRRSEKLSSAGMQTLGSIVDAASMAHFGTARWASRALGATETPLKALTRPLTAKQTEAIVEAFVMQEPAVRRLDLSMAPAQPDGAPPRRRCAPRSHGAACGPNMTAPLPPPAPRLRPTSSPLLLPPIPTPLPCCALYPHARSAPSPRPPSPPPRRCRPRHPARRGQVESCGESPYDVQRTWLLAQEEGEAEELGEDELWSLYTNPPSPLWSR